jgi:hypothetical protein|tara:strand:+ start:671 stop:1789 length:1119 start_codon:yes stop_codon:yes gene_type:complete
MQEIYNQIINLVKNNISNVNDNHVQFSDPNYKPFNFDKNNFHEIKNIESNNKIAFIDAGSSEIIKSSNFSLNLIRVYYTIYQNNKRINAKKQDFYAFVYTKNIDDELYYNAEFIDYNLKSDNYNNENNNLIKNEIKNNNEKNIFPNNEDLLLSSLDKTIKQGITRASISNMSGVIRRFAELKAASSVIDLLNNDDIIVLDGSLQCTFTNEKKYFEKLYEKASNKNIIICGLSKTTTLMTDKGSSIANALNKLNQKGKWLYNPIADIKSNQHKAEMSFVKLHESSKYIFRFEIYKEQKQHLNNIISLIANNCKDSVFIGYPYGLIEADRNARISHQEKQMLLTLFSTKLGKDWEKIKQSISSINAHEILDSIS